MNEMNLGEILKVVVFHLNPSTHVQPPLYHVEARTDARFMRSLCLGIFQAMPHNALTDIVSIHKVVYSNIKTVQRQGMRLPKTCLGSGFSMGMVAGARAGGYG